jgi:hypothetical protein
MKQSCNQLKFESLGNRLAAKKTKWQSRLKGLKNTESLCKAYKETIDSESKFQENNAKILAWITKVDQKRDHKLLRQRLGIDKVYKDCGKWLFGNAEYRRWKNGEHASKPVLWLRGTGRRSIPVFDSLIIFKDAYIIHSWNWKDNINVWKTVLTIGFDN